MAQNLDVDLKIYERCLLQGSFLWENSLEANKYFRTCSNLSTDFVSWKGTDKYFSVFLQLLYGIPSHAEGPKKLTYQLSQIHTLETQRSPRTVLISLKC